MTPKIGGSGKLDPLRIDPTRKPSHRNTGLEPAFLDEYPEGSLVRVELENGRVYTGEVADHGTGGWRNDACSLYIHTEAVRGTLMVYFNREDVLEKLVPLLEAELSPSQALDYWATEDTEKTHGVFTQKGVGRGPWGEPAGSGFERRERSGRARRRVSS